RSGNGGLRGDIKLFQPYWSKMFEINKKKKVYPRLPDVWGKKDIPYYIIVFPFPDQSTEC
ncbi:hypothetical protein DW250_16300, partial [Segatella copri]